MESIKPDYNGGSFANLMSSVSRSFGIDSQYVPLRLLSVKELDKSKTVVLFLIDGLGENMIDRRMFMHNGLRGRMTSLFPATTATVIPCMFTGVAAQQHGYTGWFVYLREFGMATTVLKFMPMFGGSSLAKSGFNSSDVFFGESLANRSEYPVHILTVSGLSRTNFNEVACAKAKMHPYRTWNGMTRQLKRIISRKGKRRFVIVYWPELDALSHINGPKSAAVKRHLARLDYELEKVIRWGKGKDATFIITGDHGQKQVPKKRILWLSEHPQFNEMLQMPPCGDRRLLYCYVRKGMERKFEHYVKTRLKKQFNIRKSSELLKEGWWGLGKPHPELKNRIGDYVLFARADWAIGREFKGERSWHSGNHGGASPDEMLIPLIVFKP